MYRNYLAALAFVVIAVVPKVEASIIVDVISEGGSLQGLQASTEEGDDLSLRSYMRYFGSSTYVGLGDIRTPDGIPDALQFYIFEDLHEGFPFSYTGRYGFEFGAGPGDNLHTGIYPNASRNNLFPQFWIGPSIDYSSTSMGVNRLEGEFEILNLSYTTVDLPYSREFQLESFALRFSGYTPEAPHGTVRGSVYYNVLPEDLEHEVGAIPEPGTLALFSMGLVGLGLKRRRRSS